MVGVGPGVGADVIRQRRKRADKLRKEQQVRVINIHGTPTLAAVAPKSKKKDDAHYHWHYTPARNEQVFNRKKTDYLANKSKYYKNTNRPVSRTKQNSMSSRSSQSKSSSQSLSQYTLNSTKFLDVKMLSSSADICIEASTSESYSQGSRSTVFRDSFSFSEISLSSSSTPKTTTSDIPTADCTNKSCKSYNSFCINDDALEQDPKNKNYDDANEIKDMNTEDKSLCHNAQINFCIPKIHIEYIESSESEHDDLNDIETLNSITELIITGNRTSAASSESIKILKKYPSRDTIIDQMKNLNIDNTNHSDIELDPSDREDDAYMRQKSYHRKRKIGSIKKPSKLKQEITIKDYHKHVARQTLLDTLRRKRASKQNKDEKTGSIPKFASASRPKSIGKNFRYLTSFSKSKSNSYLDITKSNLDNVSIQTEGSKESRNESSSLKDTNESSKSETSTALVLDTTNASVSLLNNAQRFSFKHLKDQSKTAISTIQKFIEVTFDRGKSE